MSTCKGMDVSSYQGTQDWAARKAGGLVFAFAKASEGQHSRDTRFATHISGIIAAGLVPGAYHFAWPNQDVKTEAANYIGAVKAYAARSDFTHWLDLEPYPDLRNYSGRSTAQIKAWATTWMELVQAAFPKQRVGIYAGAAELSAGHVPAGVPLWYPAYPGSSVDTYAEAAAHAVPRPSGRFPLIWQFTSTPYDQSIAYLSGAELRAWAAPTKENTPVATTLSKDDVSAIAVAVVDHLIAGGGTLENSDLDRIWQRDIIPAARPPYNNPDYFAADGTTLANTTWAAKYAVQTGVETGREILARLKDLQTVVEALVTKDAG